MMLTSKDTKGLPFHDNKSFYGALMQGTEKLFKVALTLSLIVIGFVYCRGNGHVIIAHYVL